MGLVVWRRLRRGHTAWLASLLQVRGLNVMVGAEIQEVADLAYNCFCYRSGHLSHRKDGCFFKRTCADRHVPRPRRMVIKCALAECLLGRCPAGAEKLGHQAPSAAFFDTVTLDVGDAGKVSAGAVDAGYNLRQLDGSRVRIPCLLPSLALYFQHT